MKKLNKLILQDNDYSCGPIALANLLTLSGISINIPDIHRKMRTSNRPGEEGTTSDDFIKCMSLFGDVVFFKSRNQLPKQFIIEYKTGRDYHFALILKSENRWKIINHWFKNKFYLEYNITLSELRRILDHKETFCYYLRKRKK